MTATIQLAKQYTPNKLEDYVYLSPKLDGVPVRIDVFQHNAEFNAVAQSRQGKEVPSVHFIVRDLVKKVASMKFLSLEDTVNHWIFVGEVTHTDYRDFKDVSGVVRKQEPSTALVYNIFDFVDMRFAECGFGDRNKALRYFFQSAGFRSPSVQIMSQTLVPHENVPEHYNSFMRDHPNAEGMVIRNPSDKWQPGKRTWGYQKLLVDPTIDLWIVGCEEAVSQHGEPLGMAGRLIAEYKGRTIGIGPGKLTHKERVDTLQFFVGDMKSRKRMAQIKYKKDDSYDDLRQPTFQCWRDDKDVADA